MVTMDGGSIIMVVGMLTALLAEWRYACCAVNGVELMKVDVGVWESIGGSGGILCKIEGWVLHGMDQMYLNLGWARLVVNIWCTSDVRVWVGF